MMPRYLQLGGIAMLATLAQPAAAQVFATDPAHWIITQDYPAEALARREDGVVNLSFKIAPDGAATDCKIIYATASKRLRNLSCALVVQRARYRPAHDEAGKPIAGEDRLVVRWQAQPAHVEVESEFGGAIPLSPPQLWATDNDYALITQGRGDADPDMRFTIGTDGRIANCTASEGATGARTCALLAKRARFRQPRGERGEPLATRGHVAVHWRQPR